MPRRRAPSLLSPRSRRLDEDQCKSQPPWKSPAPCEEGLSQTLVGWTMSDGRIGSIRRFPRWRARSLAEACRQAGRDDEGGGALIAPCETCVRVRSDGFCGGASLLLRASIEYAGARNGGQ